MRFSSASEFSPACTAPCPSLGFTLATSRHSLLTFCLPLRYLASCAPLDLAVCLSHLRSFDCHGVSLHLEVALPRCYPSGAPSLGFLPSTLSSNSSRFRSGLIGSPKGLRTVASSALASIKTDARLYVLLRFEV